MQQSSSTGFNVANHHHAVTMSSLDISELVRSRHSDVRRSIERLMQKGVISGAPMAFVENINNLGKPVKVKTYHLGKRDSYVVVAQLSPEFTGALVDRWQELESGLSSHSLPASYKEALIALVVAEEEKERLSVERDRAIETKAWIGEKREATAMATASVEKRRANALAEKLGECKKHSTIKAVQRVTGESFSHWPMKKWCAANGMSPKDVPDETYGTVKSWPAEAWKTVNDVDLRKLFK